MKDCRTSLFIVALFAFLAVLSIPNASAATPSPSFTITATNVTMSSTTSSGVGSSTFTLTSVNGFAGIVVVGCTPPTPPIGVTVPLCNVSAGPARPAVTLAANQGVTGSVPFANAIPPCNPCPVSLPRHRGHGLAQGLAFAGVLLFGFGFRRRVPRWLTLILLSLGSLAGIAGISACGSNSAVTPGTYVYTISATDVSTSVSVTTSVNVTVP